MISDPLKILLVDDDVDAEAVRRGFRKASINNPIYRAQDGKHALEQLRRSDSPFRAGSFIILLDMKMPRMNGVEFLDSIRNDQLLRESVVFILSTSADSHDRQAAYARFVAGYITKSNAGRDYVELVRLIQQYERVVELPAT